MKVRLAVIAVCALALSYSSAAQQAPPASRIEGQVTSAIGEPLSGANIKLQSARSGGPGYAGATDVSGNFAIDDISPGAYNLSADREGYVGWSSNAVLTISQGQVKNGLSIKLTPEAVISGKVTGADAEPMEKVKVTLYRREFALGRWELRLRGETSTASDGSFQFARVPGGKYFVSADRATTPKDADESDGLHYVTTYYPSAVDVSGAAPADAEAGRQTQLDIHLRKERSYHLRGKVINSVTGDPAKNCVIKIAPAEVNPSVGLIPPRSGMTKEGGSFEFDHLMPGRYLILASSSSGLGDLRAAAREIVNLADVDVDDVTIQFAALNAITGSLHVEGVDQQPALNAEILLVATDQPGQENVQMAPIGREGTFRLLPVTPGAYEIRLNRVPPGMYVKSMRFSGQELRNQILDDTSGAGGNLEIVLSPDVASLSGKVETNGVDTAPRSRVTLWGAGIIRLTMSAANGSFRFTDLPPGNYYVAAWEQVSPDLLNIPDFLGRFENQATSVTLAPKDRGTADIRMIKRSDSDAESAKFR